MCIRQWARDEEMVVHVPASAKRAITHDVVLRGLAVERDRLLNRSHLLLGCQCLVDAEDVYPEEIQLCPVGPFELKGLGEADSVIIGTLLNDTSTMVLTETVLTTVLVPRSVLV